jgi:hypothetical protein
MSASAAWTFSARMLDKDSTHLKNGFSTIFPRAATRD